MKFLRTVSITGAAVLAVSGLTVWASQAADGPAKPGDFNGDGHRELVVSARNATVGGGSYAGSIGLFPGTASGPTRTGASHLDQATESVPGDTGNFFGRSTASGDFNADGFADLAVCGESLNADTPGLVVLFGSANGLGNGIGPAMPDHGFCEAVAATDANLDGYADLVVFSDNVYLAKGSAEATTPAGWTYAQLVADSDPDGGPSWSDPEIGDVNNDGKPDLAYQEYYGEDTDSTITRLWLGNGDGFTYKSKVTTRQYAGGLAIGDTNGDGFADLALGLPTAGVGDKAAAGYVRFWKGTANGIDLSTGWRVITQDTAGVPGVVEANDAFGFSVAIGDVNGDKRSELAIGAPAEDAGTKADAGSVTVLPGSASGPNAAASVLLHQDTPGIPGAVEAKDRFGHGLAYNVYTGDGRAQLVAGSTGENGEGLAHVVKGLSTVTATVFSSRAAGIAPQGSAFGAPIEHSR